MDIPIPEFKVLLYGPGLPPAGRRARARFEGRILTIIEHGNMLMVAAQDLTLKTGGYDGRQWLIVWATREGAYSAMLQGEEALEAFIQLAPQEISRQLIQARKSHTPARHHVMLVLGLFLLLSVSALVLFWVTTDP